MSRSDVLSLYRRVLRIARSWTAQSALPHDTDTERKYIAQEARTLFRQNQQVCADLRSVDELLQVSYSLITSLLQITDTESIKRCTEECEARIEIGVHPTSNSYCYFLDAWCYQIAGVQLKMVVFCFSCQDCIIGTPILDQ